MMSHTKHLYTDSSTSASRQRKTLLPYRPKGGVSSIEIWLVVPCFVLYCLAMLCLAMLCVPMAMLWLAMLCLAMLCSGMLCSDLLCSVWEGL